MQIILKKPIYSTITPGVHEAKLTAVADIGIKEFGFGPKPQLKLTFLVEDAEGKTHTITKDVTHSMDPEATLYAAVAALLGGDIPDEMSVDELIGRSCRLVVGLKASKKGRMFSRIESFLPSARKAPAAATRDRSVTKPITTRTGTN